MLSTLDWLKEQLYHERKKLMQRQLSKTPAGNVTKLEQFSHARSKNVPSLKLRVGKDTKLEQSDQQELKLVPFPTLTEGKEVRPEQDIQV